MRKNYEMLEFLQEKMETKEEIRLEEISDREYDESELEKNTITIFVEKVCEELFPTFVTIKITEKNNEKQWLSKGVIVDIF